MEEQTEFDGRLDERITFTEALDATLREFGDSPDLKAKLIDLVEEFLENDDKWAAMAIEAERSGDDE